MTGFSQAMPRVPTSFKNSVAFVGVGDTDYGAAWRNPDQTRDQYSWALEAFKNALDDCGVQKDQIDGVIGMRIASAETFVRLVGLPNVRHVSTYRDPGRLTGVAFNTAAALIASGQCNYIAMVYGNNGRTAGVTYAASESGEGGNPYETPFGMTSPGAEAAMMWRRYQHTYGAPDGALAALAISNRYHASMNPRAIMREPLDKEKYLASRFIAAPLRLFDYCLINDGGCAVILSSAERARDLKKRPVYLAASAVATELGPYWAAGNFFRPALQDCFNRLLPAAGVTHKDVKVVEIYDHFTAAMVFAIEGAGFCKAGEGWQFIQNGATMVGKGKLPVNTSGGHTSESYMQGWGQHIELVRQLRGGEIEPGRQVPNCDIGVFIEPDPLLSAHVLVRG